MVVLAAVPAFAAFPADPPDDPGYPGQQYLFSTIPPSTPNATDPEGASGMSVDLAWRDFTTGRSDTVIAYIEGGINWHAGDTAELANKVFINRRELPPPCAIVPCTNRPVANPAAYDVNVDGVINAADYASDVRVSDANANGSIDPEDLIVAFSDGTDTDRNGYRDDISGWDFYNRQNDPATVDSAYDHANGQMKQAAAQTDNGVGGAGICPRCLIVPIKAGAESLDRTDDLAQAWLYATDIGAAVIVSVTADLGYSTFMRQAVEYAAHRGVLMVEASNDFDSIDHQGGMFWPHVLPGNGIVPDQAAPSTTTFRVRSNLTSWGTHNMFSASTDGGSTSESTPTLGGVAALLLAYGRDAVDDGLIATPLTSFEAVQVLRSTASDIDDPNLGWPGKPGWDLQYGYGRPNAWRAMQAVAAGDIPPVGWIESPDWYSLYDPTVTTAVPVMGHVEAARSPSYTWSLQFAPGAEPTDAQFLTAGSGAGTTPFDGTLGTLDLNLLPPSFWSAAYSISTAKTLPTAEKYTVTIRLRVTDASGRVGEERRSVYVHRDTTLLPGFPRRLGPSGDGQAALVDLQGQGRLAMVFGDADGRIHALDSATGAELPGWPARTSKTKVVRKHAGVTPGHEPVGANVAVADLDGTGSLSVVATSTTGRVYVFDSRGKLRPGWPRALDTGVSPPAIPRPQLPRTRLTTTGSFSLPVVYDLDGDTRPEIIQAGWDGYIHAWRGNGAVLPGWPVKVDLPPDHSPPAGWFVVQDHKLDCTPTIADLDGDGSPEVVIRSQLTDVPSEGLVSSAKAHVHAYHADGSVVAGWPATISTVAEYYGSAQEFVTEGSSTPAAADVDGDGTDEIAAGGAFGATVLLDGDGTQRYQFASGYLDPAVSFTTSGAFGQFHGTLAYVQPGTNGFSLQTATGNAGNGTGIVNMERAYDAAAGTMLTSFGQRMQGLDFFGAPAIADITGDGLAEIVDGGDSNTAHGYTSTGTQAPTWPKFTTGWSIATPSVGDLDADGDVEVVLLTREGWLFVWATPGLASANVESWHAHHDEWNTGRYGVDSRPPGAIRQLTWTPGATTATFVGAGDDWYTGTVDHYAVAIGSTVVDVAPTGPAGTVETIDVPPGTTSVSVQAIDDGGLRGTAVRAT